MYVGVCSVGLADKSPTPDDYEVTSVARECEDADRGNECHVDADEMGITCYSSCVTHYCNDETRRPTWQDLRQNHVSRPSQSDVDDAVRHETSQSANNDTENSLLPDAGKPLTN